MNNFFKLYLFLITISLGASNLAIAQNVNAATFNEAIDYINCRVIEMSFADQRGKPHLASYQTTFSNCGIGAEPAFFNRMTTFMKGLQPFPKLTYQLSQNIDAYKQRYNTSLTDKQSYNVIIEDLFKSQFMTNFGNKHPRFPNLRGQLEEYTKTLFTIDETSTELINPVTDLNAAERQEYVDSQPQPVKTPVITPSTTPTTNDERFTENDYRHLEGGEDTVELSKEYVAERMRDEEGRPVKPDNVSENAGDNSPFAGYRLLIIILVLLIVIGYILYMNGWLFRGREADASSKPGNTIKAEIELIKQEIEGLKRTSHSLEEEIEVIRYRINSKEKNQLPPSIQQNTPPKTVDIIEEAIVVPPMIGKEEITESLKGKTIYLPKPSPSGVFDATLTRDTFKRAESVYQFTIISDDGKKAAFEIYPDIATMLKALDDSENYLKPVCRANAVIHVSATKIITDEKGIVVRDNNFWRVTKKAQIHYS